MEPGSRRRPDPPGRRPRAPRRSASPPPVRAVGGQRDGAERGDVAGQVGRMTQQPVAARGRERLADVRHGGPPLCVRAVSARCFGRHTGDRGVRRRGPRPGGTAAGAARAARADGERRRATPRTMTQCSRASVPMPNVWASATGQLGRPASARRATSGAHPGPEQARDEDGDHQVERNGADADPEARVAPT